MPNGGNFSTAEMRKKLYQLSKSASDELKSAITEEAKVTLKLSQDQYVPFDKGDLKNSGTVLEPETVNGEISVKIQYGTTDETAKYAVPVHETPSRYDPPSWKGKLVRFKHGGPKYLEIPLKLSANGLLQRVAARMKLR